jgi:hypothetical protein
MRDSCGWRWGKISLVEGTLNWLYFFPQSVYRSDPLNAPAVRTTLLTPYKGMTEWGTILPSLIAGVGARLASAASRLIG